MKPIIGITECYKFENYVYAIEKHGGKVEELIIGTDQSNTKIDGLLLPGGGDIDPELYGEDRYHKTINVNRAKDNFEISLFNNAIENDIPIFGICRGIQIVNVAMGGSLFQHIPEHLPQQFPDFPIHSEYCSDPGHDIKINKRSLLNQIVGEGTAKVNSSHHQAVKVIGEGVVVTAQSKDGIIEAMEYLSKDFVLCVQYHPERMWVDPTPPLSNGEYREHSKEMFEAFIDAAAEHSVS